jgi:FkbM family methyltransferase
MKKVVLFLYRLIFLHQFMTKLNHLIYLVSLRGIGVLNYENKKLSGEVDIIRRLAKWNDRCVIFDVGANEGEYAVLCKEKMPQSIVYAFEPHPRTFARLSEKAGQFGFEPVHAALTDVSGKAMLFDYTGSSGTSHASLYSSVIKDIHHAEFVSTETTTWSIDDFIKDRGIERINLLKIDTEGNEYKVLMGASQAIREQQIDVIQFEFSELNIIARTFMKDFYDLLPNYTFYRLLPGGVFPLGPYNAAKCEIFLFQNVLAVSNRISSKLLR